MVRRSTWLGTSAILALCVWTLGGTALGSLYTFEDVSTGTLNGQDNWAYYPAYPSNGFVVQDGTGTNTSQVAKSVSSRPAFAIRPNDANFSFAPHSSTETAAVFQYDIQARTTDTVSTYFGCAHDADGSGSINTVNERGPAFGIIKGASSAYGFAIQHLGNSVGDSVVENFATWTAAERAALDGDWLTLRMSVDFTANGGNGAAQLSYMNLTDGETAFSDIGSPVNLGLTTRYTGTYAALANPANWDTMAIARGNDTGMAVDNLMPNLDSIAVPEPSSSVIFGLALLGLIGCRRRRR